MPQQTATPASTATFTTSLPPSNGINEAGRQSVGSWNSNPAAGLNGAAPLELLPAPVNVQLGGTPGAVQQGSPQQWTVIMSLSDSPTLQIVANMANSQNEPVTAVAPQVFSYTYVSRQSSVCTVNADGLVTATGRGQTEIEVWSTRSCNASFVGATPSGTEGVRASLIVTVVA
jgi:hypothetical protein